MSQDYWDLLDYYYSRAMRNTIDGEQLYPPGYTEKIDGKIEIVLACAHRNIGHVTKKQFAVNLDHNIYDILDDICHKHDIWPDDILDWRII